MRKPTKKALLEALKEDPDLLHRLHRLLQPRASTDPVTGPEEAFRAVLPYLFGQEREVLVGLALDAKRRVHSIEALSVGSDRFTVVDPRYIMRWTLTLQGGPASGLVLAHNHPSGDAEPSTQDLEVTRRIAKAGDAVGVPLLDHLVVGSDQSYVSLRERRQELFLYMPTPPGWTS